MSDVMSDEKWEDGFHSNIDQYNKNVIKAEKEYLDKLVDNHWNYIEGLLEVSGVIDVDIAMCEYHYKTSAKHFWSHAREYHKGSTL
jgi:hypothetical protein